MTKPHITLSNEKGNSISFFYNKEKDLKEALRRAHIPLDQFTPSLMQKINVKSITFTDGEGRNDDNVFPITFQSWSEANAFIFKRSLLNRDCYYLKTFFTVVFEDGYEYSGKYEIQCNAKHEEKADLGAHIKSHALLYAGRDSPSHITLEQQKQLISFCKPEHRQQLEHLLDNYKIEVSSPNNIFRC